MAKVPYSDRSTQQKAMLGPLPALDDLPLLHSAPKNAIYPYTVVTYGETGGE
jgi:hypothetical protein